MATLPVRGKTRVSRREHLKRARRRYLMAVRAVTAVSALAAAAVAVPQMIPRDSWDLPFQAPVTESIPAPSPEVLGSSAAITPQTDAASSLAGMWRSQVVKVAESGSHGSTQTPPAPPAAHHGVTLPVVPGGTSVSEASGTGAGVTQASHNENPSAPATLPSSQLAATHVGSGPAAVHPTTPHRFSGGGFAGGGIGGIGGFAAAPHATQVATVADATTVTLPDPLLTPTPTTTDGDRPSQPGGTTPTPTPTPTPTATPGPTPTPAAPSFGSSPDVGPAPIVASTAPRSSSSSGPTSSSSTTTSSSANTPSGNNNTPSSGNTSSNTPTSDNTTTQQTSTNTGGDATGNQGTNGTPAAGGNQQFGAESVDTSGTNPPQTLTTNKQQAQQVPEPSVLILAGTAVAGFTMSKLRERRGRKSSATALPQ